MLDEARLAGRTADSFKHADEDYFRDMDGALALTPQEVAGRNMWLVWSGGNDRLWNMMTGYTFGAFDLLKIHQFASQPGLWRAAIAGPIWDWSTNPASRRPPGRTRNAAACGLTYAARIARPTRSTTTPNTPA